MLDLNRVLAFAVQPNRPPAEVRVNFGMFAGRQATPAEVDNLARALHEQFESFTIVAEQRHQFGGAVEASIHQVVVEVEREVASDDISAMCDRVVEIADQWVGDCVAARQTDVAEI